MKPQFLDMHTAVVLMPTTMRLADEDGLHVPPSAMAADFMADSGLPADGCRVLPLNHPMMSEAVEMVEDWAGDNNIQFAIMNPAYVIRLSAPSRGGGWQTEFKYLRVLRFKEPSSGGYLIQRPLGPELH